MPSTDPTPAPVPAAAPPATAASPGKPGKFVRLPGRPPSFRTGVQGFGTLYLADTYLVQLQVQRLRESYVKFEYKDIQALEICRTSRATVYNAILGVIAALFLLGGAAASDQAARYTLSIMAGFFLVILVAHLLRGATCRCIIQTATGKHRLHTLVRMRPARRALAMLTERIAAAQGTIDQATAARQMEDFLTNQSARNTQRATAATPADRAYRAAVPAVPADPVVPVVPPVAGTTPVEPY